MRLFFLCFFSLLLNVALPCLASAQGFIISTSSIIEDWLKHIVDPETRIISLIPQEADPHAFELSAQDLVKLEKADLIFAHGLGFEGGVLDAIRHNTSLKPVLLSDALKARQPDSLSADPHTWMNPEHALGMIDLICETLSAQNPLKASTYRERSAQYKAEIKALDAALGQELASIPSERRYLLCQHDNLSYFAKHYGFTVLPSLHYHSEDPSALHYRHLLKIIKQYHIRAIFYDPRENSTLVQNLAAAAHIQAETLIVESLHPEAPSYLSLMAYTARKIQSTLQD